MGWDDQNSSSVTYPQSRRQSLSSRELDAPSSATPIVSENRVHSYNRIQQQFAYENLGNDGSLSFSLNSFAPPYPARRSSPETYRQLPQHGFDPIPHSLELGSLCGEFSDVDSRQDAAGQNQAILRDLDHFTSQSLYSATLPDNASLDGISSSSLPGRRQLSSGAYDPQLRHLQLPQPDAFYGQPPGPSGSKGSSHSSSEMLVFQRPPQELAPHSYPRHMQYNPITALPPEVADSNEGNLSPAVISRQNTDASIPTVETYTASSIPMSNNRSGWSRSAHRHSSLSSVVERHERQHTPSHIASSNECVPSPTTSDSGSSTSVVAMSSSAPFHSASVHASGQKILAASSSSPASPSSSHAKKKKKSKMHECEICGKKFPRPSGLRTHMNTHNNSKPYACDFPGCQRTFGVRSNAKRHLRTHGIIPAPAHSIASAEVPYVVGFSAPIVLPPLDTERRPEPGQSQQQMGHVPFFKLRWMPPSLTSRVNAAKLRAALDHDSFSDEEDDDDRVSIHSGIDDKSLMNQASSRLSIPLPPVISSACRAPGSCACASCSPASSPMSPTPSSFAEVDDPQFEERNSFLAAGSHPYHPSQFRVLPGPAAVPPRSYVLA